MEHFKPQFIRDHNWISNSNGEWVNCNATLSVRLMKYISIIHFTLYIIHGRESNQSAGEGVPSDVLCYSWLVNQSRNWNLLLKLIGYFKCLFAPFCCLPLCYSINSPTFLFPSIEFWFAFVIIRGNFLEKKFQSYA